MQRSLSAPGKLFVSGEYAVLWGGTARVVAVGPRIRSLIRQRDDREVHLLLEEGRWKGSATPAGVHWGNDKVPDPFRFVATTVDLALRTFTRETMGFELGVMPSPRSASGLKLGLGGSARAVVLASEAVRYISEQRWDPLKLALLAHADAQGGKGSGADVAAIFAGGFIRYRRYDLTALRAAALGMRLGAALLAASPVDVLRLSPPRLPLSYVFTGAAASTPSLIKDIEQRWDADARQRFADDSDTLGQELEETLIQGDFTRARDCVGALHRKLLELGPLEPAAMKRVLALAHASGSAGKLSGAGGGDGCLIISPDAGAQADMLEAMKERGFWGMPLSLEPGLQGELTADPLLDGWLSR